MAAAHLRVRRCNAEERKEPYMSLTERILRQCRKPKGRFGRFLARGMNFGHSGITKWGLGFIDIACDATALDIGCGGGKTVERLAAIAANGKVVGIDYSPDAVAVARKKNRAFINEGRVEILQEAVSSMQFSNGAFDLVTAVETHYFWPDFRNDLKEVYRVLKQGGQLLIVGAVYRNKKFDRRNQRIVSAIGMIYLSIEEFRDILGSVGFSEFDAFEEKEKGWICVRCIKPERSTA
jgi:SAM-dependent methyltransferase